MDGMRILITNNTLANRAGSELYVRDVAKALLARGHTPIAFSTILGDVADELRAATVPVVDSLEDVATPPDIIHGQHHLETMIALLHFPNTPALSFCHGWLPWEEIPPRFPRIMRYVAVDHTCRDRLVCENGIPEDRIRVLLNFVDLERFKTRGPLPARPKRALVFHNSANDQQPLGIVREACNRAGIALDIIGLNAGNVCTEPEKVLGDYDIVFAKARSAIESMAVGAAVILFNLTTMGSMVTTSELDRLRPINFGIRALQEPLSLEAIEREIARYDANDAARVSERIRSTAGLDSAVEEILGLYEASISEFALMERDSEDELRAASEYLRSLSPRVKEDARLNADRYELQNEVNRLRQERSAMSDNSGDQEISGILLPQIDDCSRNAQGLLNRFRDKEDEAVALQSQLAAKEQEAVALELKLSEKELELERITNTLGWRLLSRYGPIKYRFVLPAYRRLQRLLNKTPERQ